MNPFFAAAVLAPLLLLNAADGLAQRFPGRERGDSPRDFQQREREPKRGSIASSLQEPFAALERELPSLKVDLLLTREQVGAWSTFERGVRELAEMDRARRKHLLALRDAEGGPPSASRLIGMLAADDRRKAEASAELERRFGALYATLDAAQQAAIDRRVVLSQTQTLGQETLSSRY